jgi:hypothetical protein
MQKVASVSLVISDVVAIQNLNVIFSLIQLESPSGDNKKRSFS